MLVLTFFLYFFFCVFLCVFQPLLYLFFVILDYFRFFLWLLFLFFAFFIDFLFYFALNLRHCLLPMQIIFVLFFSYSCLSPDLFFILIIVLSLNCFKIQLNAQKDYCFLFRFIFCVRNYF